MTSSPKKLCLAACITLLDGIPLRLVNGEEASIMADAIVTSSLNSSTPDGDVLINGSYKSHIRAANSSANEAVIALSYPKTLQTVVLVAHSYSINFPDRIGDSQIILVNSAGLETISKSHVYDTGIYTLDPPGEAASIIIRRVSGQG